MDPPINDLKQEMEDMYQCIVCYSIPYGRVLQCPSGHITCEWCSARTATCPMCRAQLDPDVSKRIRNLAVERTIEAAKLTTKCRNDGCLLSGHKKEMVLHSEKCPFRSVSCPFYRVCAVTALPFYKIAHHLTTNCEKT